MGDDGSWDHAVLYLTLMALVRNLKPTLPPLLLLPKPSANALPGHLVMSLAGQAPRDFWPSERKGVLVPGLESHRVSFVNRKLETGP